MGDDGPVPPRRADDAPAVEAARSRRRDMRLSPDPAAGVRTATPALQLCLLGLTMGVVLGACLSLAAPRGLAPGLAVHLCGLWLAVRGMAAGYPHARLGACNVATTMRLALVGAIAGIGIAQGAGWAVAGLATIALVFDGIDGWLARRGGLSSAFGASYDMEIDAALAACLALILMAAGRAGPELLLLGFARYAFVLASLVLPWLAAPMRESFRRKAVCVAQIATLVILTAPVLPDDPARILALGAAALLAWSFLRDIRRLAACRS